MITVEEAIHRIQATTISFPTMELPLDQSLGYVLREPVLADRDFPPYDRVTMDGIAFRFESWREGFAFPVQGMQQAGEAQQGLYRKLGAL